MTGERRLRVLITTSTFPVQPGDGVPRFILDLALALAEHADITVLAPAASGAARRETQGAVDIRRFSYFYPEALQQLAIGQGIPDNLRRSWLARLQVPGFLMRELTAVRRLAREKQVDIVNAHWLVPQGLTAALALGRRRSPALVAHGHGGDLHLLRDMPFGRPLAEFIIRRSQAVLVSGSGLQDILNSIVGYDVGARLQPMGVDLDLFGERARAEVQAVATDALASFPEGFLLFVGRMIELKGVVYLVRALPRIREVHPGLGLVLIGDGPERPRIEREVERLGLQHVVRLLGKLPQDEVAAYLRRCRVAVVPSIIDSTGRTDGMPTVILEAMAAGARVVASAVGGIPDVVSDGENGWLSREKDPEDLAQKILTALDHPQATEFAKRAAESARRFKWKAVAGNYMWCFEDVMSPSSASQARTHTSSSERGVEE